MLGLLLQLACTILLLQRHLVMQAVAITLRLPTAAAAPHLLPTMQRLAVAIQMPIPAHQTRRGAAQPLHCH